MYNQQPENSDELGQNEDHARNRTMSRGNHFYPGSLGWWRDYCSRALVDVKGFAT